MSADGATLLLTSSRELSGYRNHGVSELYLYRPGRGPRLRLLQPERAGAGEARRGCRESPGSGPSSARNYAFTTRNLSADGRRVIFDSADSLLSADHNTVNDVYEWEAAGKGSCTTSTPTYEPSSGGCLFLISTGAASAGPSWFGDADEEGENVFFFTAQPLVAQDKDELVDVYDARVGGGIAAQEAEPPAPCIGEAECLPQAGGEPLASTPRSPTANGQNVTPPKPCKKGLVRKHGKCVKKPAKKQKGHHGKKHKKKNGAKKGKGKQNRAGTDKKGGSR